MDDRALILAYLETNDYPCPYCQYNLRGIKHPRCPECGHEPNLEAILRRARTKDEGVAIYIKGRENLEGGWYLRAVLKLLLCFVIGIVVIVVLAIVLPAVLPSGYSTHPLLP